MMTETQKLYEQAKAIIRHLLEVHDYNAGNFILSCHECEEVWKDNIEMGMVEAHFEMMHNSNKIKLNLIYIGEGMPPESQK